MDTNIDYIKNNEKNLTLCVETEDGTKYYNPNEWELICYSNMYIEICEKTGDSIMTVIPRERVKKFFTFKGDM